MEQEPSTRITLRHVWQEQQEMKELLQKVAQHLPTVAQKLEEHERDTKKILDDHELRIRNVERNLWKVFGAIALIASLTPFIARLMP